MSNIGFFDLLGVTTVGEAVARWPIEHLPMGDTALGQLVQELEGALTFRNLLPSASGDSIGLVADVVVGAATPSVPVVFAALPKLEFHLLPTTGEPARLYARQSRTGVEWIVEALPVEIALPDGLFVPIDPRSGDLTTGTFVSGSADTYAIDLRATAPSLLRAHVKLLCSEERDFVLEFAGSKCPPPFGFFVRSGVG